MYLDPTAVNRTPEFDIIAQRGDFGTHLLPLTLWIRAEAAVFKRLSEYSPVR
jgi:hypothetical protein